MFTRGVFLGVLALTIPLLVACGGGSGLTTTAAPPALNTFEQELVGTYELREFAFIQPGVGGFETEDFEEFAGEMSLGSDGFARIHMELCQGDEANQQGCDRLFKWTADAGWIYLECLEGGDDAWAIWEQGALDHLTTEFRVPTNHPECKQIVVEDGFEVFTWKRVD